jgi:hypothetical protein
MDMAGALECLSWKRQTDSATFSYSPNRIPRVFPLVLSHLTRECPCPLIAQREAAASGAVRRSRERKQFKLVRLPRGSKENLNAVTPSMSQETGRGRGQRAGSAIDLMAIAPTTNNMTRVIKKKRYTR